MRKLMMGLAVSSMILTACNKAPELSFDAPSTVTVGESADFTNNSDVKKAYNVNWSFGDGATANTWNASHVYDEAGTYTVTLSATSGKGHNSATQTAEVVVEPRDIDALEDKNEADAVAADAWWLKANGTWAFTSGKFEYVSCEDSDDNLTRNHKPAVATKLMFYVDGQGYDGHGETYMMDQYGNKMDWSIDYVDEGHVSISSISMPYADTDDDHAAQNMSGGIYTYVNSGTTITLKRVAYSEVSYFDNGDFKFCEDTRTYDIVLTKQ